MRPIVKWNGGKSRDIKYFKDKIPEYSGRYIEPFFGGGGLYFYLLPEKSIISDANADLIKFYKELAQSWHYVQAELEWLHEEYERLDEDDRRDMFFKIRDLLTKRRDTIYDNGIAQINLHYASIYYFINRTCFSGKMQCNRQGAFNTGFGKYAHFNNLITDDQIKVIQSWNISCRDFEDTLRFARPDDFVFLDPPYAGTDRRGYGKSDYFGDAEQERLAKVFAKLSCKAMLVVKDVSMMRKLYAKYLNDNSYISYWYGKKYSINQQDEGANGHVNHLVICNYGEEDL